MQNLEEKIGQFIDKNEQNFVAELDMMQIYDQPLISIAKASDPLWKELKKPEIIGPHHLTPIEWLPQAKSVISYFLPFSEQVRTSNKYEGPPSIECFMAALKEKFLIMHYAI